MATIKSLIERIEKRLFLVAGLDVQIHAEEQLTEMLRGAYNTLFDDFWYPDYTLYMTAQLNGTTGEITTDVSNVILRYADINSVYWDEDERPLPRVAPGAAVGRIRTRSIMPSGDPETVFKLIPEDTTGPVHIWYRTRISDDIWEAMDYENTTINMDDEVLMHAVLHEFLVNDGSNPEATAEYEKKFARRQQQLRQQQWQIPLSKRPLERDGPATRWE